MVTASFGYLWTLFDSGTLSTGETQLWHCSPYFRGQSDQTGRGYLTLDSDGHVGPCQEFPHLVNILEIPENEISLQLLDEHFANVTKQCSGCLYNCYSMEEKLQGVTTIAEATTFIKLSNVNMLKK
jgi:MoaA/NifB/PqqE/SkfB family radical SAM enzyme